MQVLVVRAVSQLASVWSIPVDHTEGLIPDGKFLGDDHPKKFRHVSFC